MQLSWCPNTCFVALDPAWAGNVYCEWLQVWWTPWKPVTVRPVCPLYEKHHHPRSPYCRSAYQPGEILFCPDGILAHCEHVWALFENEFTRGFCRGSAQVVPWKNFKDAYNEYVVPVLFTNCAYAHSTTYWNGQSSLFSTCTHTKPTFLSTILVARSPDRWRGCRTIRPWEGPKRFS